jgi:hypothetical protein
VYPKIYGWFISLAYTMFSRKEPMYAVNLAACPENCRAKVVHSYVMRSLPSFEFGKLRVLAEPHPLADHVGNLPGSALKS